MKLLKHLFEKNLEWAAKTQKDYPGFFESLAQQQSPEYLWIGCSDSRVPANELMGLMPGEVFVHRNVANIVVHTDFNCLSVLQYAVDVLKIKHVIVCGHYDCGGIKAAMTNEKHGLIDNWLRNIKDVYRMHQDELERLEEQPRIDRLCEINVVEQVSSIGHTTIVQDAWDRGQELTIHGWIYSVKDGLLRDLNVCTSNKEQLLEIYRTRNDNDR